ncbi:MAG TPA: hypothetical protein VK821_01505, partial [Dehalococcoidia bacterium]|nr:hypothetical protein [Dehalococcoidia bacterium]
MERLPLAALIDGDYQSLGQAFRPLPDQLAQSQGRRLVAPADVVEQAFSAEFGTWQLTLEIPVAVMVYMVTRDGHRFVTAKYEGGTVKVPRVYGVNAPKGGPYTYILVEATSGAFVSGFNANANDEVFIGPGDLRPLNNPGLPEAAGQLPTPANSGSPLPADSPPVLVATGVVASNGNILARTQHWQKSDDSYSLPGCATLSFSLTQTTGLTSSSSEMSTLSTQVGFQASVGWGPISSSVSASMSQTSTTTQDMTISETTEATLIREFRNDYTTPMVVYLWQLVDRLLVIDPSTYSLIGMLETVVQPVIPLAYDSLGGVYPP